MPALTYQATPRADGTHIVARSTDDELGTAAAALVVDNSLSKLEVRGAAYALLRALSRDELRATKPSSYPTSGTSVE